VRGAALFPPPKDRRRNHYPAQIGAAVSTTVMRSLRHRSRARPGRQSPGPLDEERRTATISQTVAHSQTRLNTGFASPCDRRATVRMPWSGAAAKGAPAPGVRIPLGASEAAQPSGIGLVERVMRASDAAKAHPVQTPVEPHGAGGTARLTPGSLAVRAQSARGGFTALATVGHDSTSLQRRERHA
jgi:hypothetical protein